MNWELWLVILLIVGAFAWHGSKVPSPYRARTCTGKAWKRAFPNESSQRIRAFLLCFTDGMAFPSATKLNFHPNDQVLDVYRSIYGGRTPLGDHMECETFLENVSREFGVHTDALLANWHSEVTLGELFGHAVAQQSVQPDRRADAASG